MSALDVSLGFAAPRPRLHPSPSTVDIVFAGAVLARTMTLAAVAEWEAQHGALTKPELAAARQRVASQLGATFARPRKRSA